MNSKILAMGSARFRVAISFSLLFACSSAPPRPADPSLLGRQDCMKELNGESIHSAEDFLNLGERKRKEALRAGNDDEKRRLYRCALSAYEAASVLSPSDERAPQGAGDLYFDIRDLAAASAKYHQALALSPGIHGVNLRLAQIARNGGDLLQALHFLDEEMRVNPDGDDAYVERGNMEMSDKRFEAAKEFFGKAYARNRSNVHALFGRGVAKHLLADYQGALQDFDRILQLNPDAILEVYWQIGLIHQKRNEPAKAVKAFRDYQKRMEPNSAAWKSADKKIRDLSPQGE